MAMFNSGDRLLPWYIGLVIIVAAVSYVGYLFHVTNCQATGLSEFLALIVMPAVYLALVYLTLKSHIPFSSI